MIYSTCFGCLSLCGSLSRVVAYCCLSWDFRGETESCWKFVVCLTLPKDWLNKIPGTSTKSLNTWYLHPQAWKKTWLVPPTPSHRLLRILLPRSSHSGGCSVRSICGLDAVTVAASSGIYDRFCRGWRSNFGFYIRGLVFFWYFFVLAGRGRCSKELLTTSAGWISGTWCLVIVEEVESSLYYLSFGCLKTPPFD